MNCVHAPPYVRYESLQDTSNGTELKSLPFIITLAHAVHAPVYHANFKS